MSARPIQPPTVPDGPLQSSAGRSIPQAREVNDLVRWAITERSRAITRGWSKVPATYVQQHMVALQTWVQRYPVPCPETMRWFLHSYWHHVRAVMPGSPAGKKKLLRLEELLRQA